MNELDQQTATATEDAAPPQIGAPAVGEQKPFACDKCDKSFDKQSALAMHRVRVHTRAGKRGWKLAIDRSHRARLAKRKLARWTPPGSRQETLAQRREKARQDREQWYAQGLNSHGQPYKRRGAQVKLRGARASLGLTKRGTPRKRAVPKSTAQRVKMREYQQGHYWRKRAAKGFQVPPDKQHYLMTYENGAQPNEKLGMSATAALRLPRTAPEKPAAPAAGRVVMFCPCCGANIQNVQTAVNFGG